MFHATLAKANDLIVWADRLDARHEFSRLVRDLVHASAHGSIESINFPADEGIQKSGWDGLVRISAGATFPFVPSGLSVWELGTNGDPGSKATRDYNKRSANPLGVDTAQSTYVFVTLRRWFNKNNWVQARNEENKWREVKAYDVDDLIAWLEISPSAHIRVSQRLNLRPDGVLPLQTFWEGWTQATQPPFTAEFVIGGRRSSQEFVVDWLNGQGGTLTLEGDSPDDALAFFAATIDSLDEMARGDFWSRAIVVDSESAWRSLTAVTTQKLILIPRCDVSNSIGLSVQNGHYVLLPIGHVGATKDSVTLPRPRRDALEKALSEMDFKENEERVSSYATVARLSMMALRRKLAIAPSTLTPPWVNDPAAARKLIGPLLAGVWVDNSEGDSAVLARLAGTTYEEVQQTFLYWKVSQDPFFRQSGEVCMVASHEDAWRLLGKFITPSDLLRFQEVALEVLGTHDPALDLPQEERVFANMRGKALAHSAQLRKGIAGTLAIMATFSDTVPLAGSSSGGDIASRTVYKLLREKGKNNSSLWASLDNCLTLLAEAAPTIFLDAVEEGLVGIKPTHAELFKENDHYFFTGSSHHIYLLWALEVLAWHEETLPRAALCLSKLTTIDPGGESLNRPGNSLHDIFRCWFPCTSATASKRLAVLELLSRRTEPVAWSLMVSLLPRNHETGHFTCKPEWRDWLPDNRGRVSNREYFDTTTEIVERLLQAVEYHPNRWLDILQATPSLLPHQREMVMAKLDALDLSLFTDEEKMRMRDALREPILRHRDHADTEWAMPAKDVDRLAVFLDRLLPGDPRARHRWLFHHWPPMPERYEVDADGGQTRLRELRTDALNEIIASFGMDAAVAFAETVQEPWTVGETLGRFILAEDRHDEFLQENLDASEAWRAQMIHGFINGCSYAFGQPWIFSKLEIAKRGELLTPNQWGEFFLGVPFGTIPVQDIDTLPNEAQRTFWSSVNHVGFPETPDEADRFAERLIRFGRPDVALNMADAVKGRQPSPLTPDRIAEILDACFREGNVKNPFEGQSFGYHSGQLLDYLFEAGFDRERLAKLEFLYLPIHRHQRHPKLLHEEMSLHPNVFVDVLSLVYKPTFEGELRNDDEPDDRETDGDVATTEEQTDVTKAAVAQSAYGLLSSWHSLPGIQNDGSLDAEELRGWVMETRVVAGAAGFSRIADVYIGHAFAYSPMDADGAWPHQAVRELIDELESQSLLEGFEVQIYNKRGVTSRSPIDGGGQEMALAEQFEGWAAKIIDKWPRTASTLQAVAKDYMRQAQREDHNADFNQDHWS